MKKKKWFTLSIISIFFIYISLVSSSFPAIAATKWTPVANPVTPKASQPPISEATPASTQQYPSVAPVKVPSKPSPQPVANPLPPKTVPPPNVYTPTSKPPPSVTHQPPPGSHIQPPEHKPINKPVIVSQPVKPTISISVKPTSSVSGRQPPPTSPSPNNQRPPTSGKPSSPSARNTDPNGDDTTEGRQQTEIPEEIVTANQQSRTNPINSRLRTAFDQPGTALEIGLEPEVSGQGGKTGKTSGLASSTAPDTSVKKTEKNPPSEGRSINATESGYKGTGSGWPLTEGKDRNQFSAYVEKFSMGSINWDKGLIYGVGRSYYDGKNGSKTKADKDARILALENIAKVAAELQLDDQKTLQSLSREMATVDIREFIRDTEVSKTLVQDNGRPYYEVVRVAALKGTEGLTARLITENKKMAVPWITPPRPTDTEKLDDEEEAWLVLDARNVPLPFEVKPALFPKIFTDKGEEIYSLRLVRENALLQRGMASYVTSGKSLAELQPELQADMEPLESILARVSDMLAVREAAAAGSRERRKRQRFVIKEVKYAKGLQRTNLVVSASDAKALIAEDASSKILQNCRVIIVLSSPVGGIEGAIFRIITWWS